jgi:hypothetical protein
MMIPVGEISMVSGLNLVKVLGGLVGGCLLCLLGVRVSPSKAKPAPSKRTKNEKYTDQEVT